MACTDGISKNIISDCTTSGTGGTEEVVYIFNRTDLVITRASGSNKVTALTMSGAALGYTATGVKKLFDAGHDIVIAENRPDKFAHYFKMEQFEFNSTDIANIDNLQDVVICYERKDKTTTADGTFVILGLTHGLYKSSDTKRENAANGARTIELKSLAGEEEPYSAFILHVTDYATTKAALVATLT
jgi:hypothetical protein